MLEKKDIYAIIGGGIGSASGVLIGSGFELSVLIIVVGVAGAVGALIGSMLRNR